MKEVIYSLEVGTVIAAFICYAYLVIYGTIQIIKSLKYLYKERHRYNKPSTAKCYCRDCKFHRDDRKCHSFVNESTDDSWFFDSVEKSMTLTEFLNKKYRERKDKDNMYGVGMNDAEFRHFIIEYLLPEGWCVSDPLGQSQINEIAIYEILEKHSKKFRKERRLSKHNKNYSENKS